MARVQSRKTRRGSIVPSLLSGNEWSHREPAFLHAKSILKEIEGNSKATHEAVLDHQRAHASVPGQSLLGVAIRECDHQGIPNVQIANAGGRTAKSTYRGVRALLPKTIATLSQRRVWV